MLSTFDGSNGGLELAVLGRIWRFGRGDGSLIAPHVRLVRGGGIRGHSQKNESGWQVVDGALEFTDPAGEVTCRFETSSRGEQGELRLEGEFRRRPGVTHVLQEVRALTRRGPPNAAPRVALLVRTHVANEKLFDLLDTLHQSRRYDLFVVADETRQSLELRGYQKLSHTADSGRRHGLPHQHSRILWHCGDYPLYFAAAEAPGYDYYVMMEYDVDLVRKSPLFLEGLFARLTDPEGEGVDLVGAAVGPAVRGWCWAQAAIRLFPVVYTTGTFAFLAVSRRGLEHLLSVRREEGRSGAAGDDIVHCEALCASALMAAGQVCVPINALVDGAVESATFHPAYSNVPNSELLLNHYILDNPCVELVHPVYDLQPFLERRYQRAVRCNTLPDFLAGMPQLQRPGRADTDLITKYRELALASISKS